MKSYPMDAITKTAVVVALLYCSVTQAAFRRVRFIAIAESHFSLPKEALNPTDRSMRALDYPDTTLTCQIHLRNVSGTDQEVRIPDFKYFSAPTPDTSQNKHNEQGSCIGTRVANGTCDATGVRSTMLNQTFIYRLNSRANAHYDITSSNDFPITLNRYSMNGDAALIQWRRRVPIIPNYDNGAQVARQQHVTHYCTGTIEVRDVTTLSITKPGAVIASGALEFVAGNEYSSPRPTTQLTPPSPDSKPSREVVLEIEETSEPTPPSPIAPYRPRSDINRTEPLLRSLRHVHGNSSRSIRFNTNALQAGVEYYLLPDPAQRQWDIARGGAQSTPSPIYQLSNTPSFLALRHQINARQACGVLTENNYQQQPSVLNSPDCNSNACAEEITTTGVEACPGTLTHNFDDALGVSLPFTRVSDPQLDPFFDLTTTQARPTDAPNILGVYYNFPQHIHSMPIVINGGKPF